MTWDVHTAEQLSLEGLVSLRQEEVAAIRVAGYCTADSARNIAQLLVEHPERTNYQARWAHAGRSEVVLSDTFSRTDVDRVGPVDSSPEAAAGSGPALAMIREIRAVAAPGLAPIDRLRLELDEIAPSGAGLHRKDGRVSLSGVGRVMHESQELIHADTGRRECLTANVYLRMPKRGGGTRIWQYDGTYRQSRQSYHFGRNEIPSTAHSCLLQPVEGDLVIWNPALPHAVLAFDDGPRVTLQTWLLFNSGGDPADFSIRLLN